MVVPMSWLVALSVRVGHAGHVAHIICVRPIDVLTRLVLLACGSPLGSWMSFEKGAAQILGAKIFHHAELRPPQA